MIYGNIIAENRRANSLFELDDRIHRHNPTFTPRLLREEFLKRGIEVNTPDMNHGKEVKFDLLLEGSDFTDDGIPKYLVALENPNINKLNATREYCARFSIVFAWDARLHDLPNVVPILIPHPLQYGDFPGFEQRDIFSCLINANKAFRETLPSDLYVERLKTISWYEKNAIDKFSLYGMGWTKPAPAFTLPGRIARGVASLRTKLLGVKPFPSYQGEVTDKSEILRRSKYSYCYENSRDLSNYITEKIFDSLVCGCVPVYWGADNILDFIPAGCFVDRRQYNDTASVHRKLLSISADDFAEYQTNIRKFLDSETAKRFSSEYVVSTIVARISKDAGVGG